MTFTRYPIVGKWSGIISDVPSANDDLAFDDALNVLVRKGRIQSRPLFTPVTPPPDGRPIRAMYTFADVLDHFHTLVLTDTTAYFLTNSSGTLVYNALTLPISNLGVGPFPFSLREINQQVYFANGIPPLMYVDGSASAYVAGNAPGAPYFLTENSEQLIGINWTELSPFQVGTNAYPFRVRWSDTGDPTQWISAPGNTAGANDLIETGGILTGASTIGRNTYITRKNGATVMYPTGQAIEPFSFEPFMWSEPGWGNYFPYSLVTWSYYCICITREAEVLLFDGSNFTRLAGGKMKLRLAQDLSHIVNDQVVSFGLDSFGPSYDFEGYGISIPGPNISWLHNLEEGTWMRFNSSLGWLTTAARVAVQ
jgi:hypothetical protein